MSMPYRIEITNLETGETRMVPSFGVHYVNDDALKVWRQRMCDCNLFGYFYRGWERDSSEGKKWEWDTNGAHDLVAGEFRHRYGCDHTMPPTRFKAVAMHLEDGRVLTI
jgi:hypothetical protein